MTDADHRHKPDEFDHLPNDPDMPMEPARVWSLPAKAARHDLAQAQS